MLWNKASKDFLLCLFKTETLYADNVPYKNEKYADFQNEIYKTKSLLFKINEKISFEVKLYFEWHNKFNSNWMR